MTSCCCDHLSPDCIVGKHTCAGDAWCTERDEMTLCECPCHQEAS